MLALVIDDGPRPGGVGSTIVDCTSETSRILREGALSKDVLGL
jgi:tRNA A37 threonylcarbamoyladenosine synthetase subunit TsaC/SUA5/YrdC